MQVTLPDRLKDKCICKTVKNYMIKLNSLLNMSGLLLAMSCLLSSVVVTGHAAEPAHLSFSRVAYRLGMALEAWAPRGCKRTLLLFGQKTRIRLVRMPR